MKNPEMCENYNCACSSQSKTILWPQFADIQSIKNAEQVYYSSRMKFVRKLVIKLSNKHNFILNTMFPVIWPSDLEPRWCFFITKNYVYMYPIFSFRWLI